MTAALTAKRIDLAEVWFNHAVTVDDENDDTVAWFPAASFKPGPADDLAALFIAAPALRDALKQLATVIDAAGVFNLSRGVELGPVVWSVKCTDAMRDAHAALAAAGVTL